MGYLNIKAYILYNIQRLLKYTSGLKSQESSNLQTSLVPLSSERSERVGSGKSGGGGGGGGEGVSERARSGLRHFVAPCMQFRLRHFVACDILSHVTFFLINYQEEQFYYAQSLQYLLSLDDLLSPLMYSPQHLQCVNSSLGFELSFFIFLLFVNKRIIAQWCSQHHCALCRSQSSKTM